MSQKCRRHDMHFTLYNARITVFNWKIITLVKILFTKIFEKKFNLIIINISE